VEPVALIRHAFRFHCKNASDICALLYEAYRGEALKKSCAFEWHNWFKGNMHVDITNEDNAHYFLQHQGYSSL
jgi:hypothetical protein